MKSLVLVYLALLVGQSSAIINYYLESYCCGYNSPIDVSFIDSVRLRLTVSDYYNDHMNCSVTFTTSSPNQLMYYLKSFDVEGTPNCTYDYLEVLDGLSLESPYASGFYGKQCNPHVSQSVVYITDHRALTLWFYSDYSRTGKGFDMIITSYHTGCNNPTQDYSCNNGRCVDNTLTCNGFNPCGDHSDCPLTIGAIVGIAVGSACFAIILVVIVVVVVRRRRRYVSAPGMTHRHHTAVSSCYEYDQAGPAQGQYQALSPPYPGNAPYQHYPK